MSDDLNPDFGISDTHPTDSSADAADAGDAVFGTASSDGVTPGGQVGPYLVVASDEDVDKTYEDALLAGGTAVAAPEDQPHGGRQATFADPERNEWSIGSYAGA